MCIHRAVLYKKERESSFNNELNEGEGSLEQKLAHMTNLAGSLMFSSGAQTYGAAAVDLHIKSAAHKYDQ